MLQDRRTLGVGVILLLVALLLGLRYGLSPFPNWTKKLIAPVPVTVTTAVIGTRNKPIPIVGTGSIESPTSVPIGTEFAGRVSQVYVSEGQMVKVGDPLVKVEGSAGGASSRGSTVTNKMGTRNQEGQSGYEDALKEYNRSKNLYEQGAIPRRQLDNATARLQELQGNSTTVQATSEEAPASIGSGAATISASINGKVVGLTTGVEKMVQSGQQLMMLDSGEVQVVIPIEEKDLSLVHLGSGATIETQGQLLLGQVVSIYPEVGTGNTPIFRTYIKATNDITGVLKIGMSVTARITTGNTVKVLIAPKTAIFQDRQGVYYIYLADNGKASRQQISVVDASSDLIEFTAELPEQAVVITSKVNDIRNGDAIVVME